MKKRSSAKSVANTFRHGKAVILRPDSHYVTPVERHPHPNDSCAADDDTALRAELSPREWHALTRQHRR